MTPEENQFLLIASVAITCIIVILCFALAHKDFKLNELTKKLTHHIPYPVAFQTVDIACVRKKTEIGPDGVSRLLLPYQYEILAGQKEDEVITSSYRLPGGFVDVTDLSREHAAEREFKEETNGEIKLTPKNYFLSMLVNDKRYRNSIHKIITSLYLVSADHYTTDLSQIKPLDDLTVLKWVDLDEKNFFDFHQKMVKAVKDYCNKEQI